MAVPDYSTNPDENTTINGLNIAEQCTPAVLNNAQRQLMADVRVMYDDLPSTANLVPKDGAVFEGVQPKYKDQGAFLHNASVGASSGKVTFLKEGSAFPSGPANGDIVFFYE